MVISNIVYFILSASVLLVSGIYLVRSLSRISKLLGISEFSSAFIIMAFATSIPELFVGISSALAGSPSLSLGNIIGANILDLTLVTGIIILSAKTIKFDSKRIGSEVYYMLVILLLVIALFFIGKELSRIDGLILLSLFFVHIFNILKRRKKYKKKVRYQEVQIGSFYWLIIFLAALVGLFISSGFVVRYASLLATDFGFPEIVIGLFLLSIATTLPEMVFGVSASRMKHKEMAIGDQIGTIVTNSAFILGLVAVINPITAEFLPFVVSSIFMFVSAFVFVTFVKTGNQLERIEAISLILLYVLFIVVQLFTGI